MVVFCCVVVSLRCRVADVLFVRVVGFGCLRVCVVVCLIGCLFVRLFVCVARLCDCVLCVFVIVCLLRSLCVFV